MTAKPNKTISRSDAMPSEVKRLARINRELDPIDFAARRELLKAQAQQVIKRKKG